MTSPIHLQVMAIICIQGDITELRVSVNGAQKGMLDSSPDASGTYAVTKCTNMITVVAKFAKRRFIKNYINLLFF